MTAPKLNHQSNMKCISVGYERECYKNPQSAEWEVCGLTIGVSEWLLLNTNSAIFQLYHDEGFNNRIRIRTVD